MKTLYLKLTLCSLLFVFLSPLNAQTKSQRFELSKDKSYVKWVAMDKEESLTGTMKLKNGYAVFEDDLLTQLVVFVNAQTFECQKCGDQEDSRKIVEYAHSEPFLNSGAMDFAVFKASDIVRLNDSKDGNYLIKGALSIKGYTNDVELTVSMEIKKEKLLADGKLTMNRSLWKLDNPSGKEAVYTVENTTELYIHLESGK